MSQKEELQIAEKMTHSFNDSEKYQSLILATLMTIYSFIFLWSDTHE